MKIFWLVALCVIGSVFVVFGAICLILEESQFPRIITQGGIKLAAGSIIVTGLIIVVIGVIAYKKNAL